MPDTCHQTLNKKYTGYDNSPYLDIYNHLIEEYVELLDDKMQENDALMKRKITDETHFEELVQQIKDCVKNEASQNLYTPAQTVSIGFNITEKRGFYSGDC